MGAAVLIVDDEARVINALRRVLHPLGHELLTARDGREAVGVMVQHDLAAIVCDYRMPGMSGVEVLQEAIKLRPDAVRIILTAEAELSVAQAAINVGRVSHFLLKPWNDDHLRTVVSDAVNRHDMERQIRRLNELIKRQRDRLEALNRDLEQKVRERTQELRNAYDETLDTLVLALDGREQATGGHSRRVAAYCLYFALLVDFPSYELEDLYRGALIHDLGKIGVPDAVLLKRGPLDAQERRVMREHVRIGAQLLSRIRYLRGAVAIPRYHHEWYDGSGYCEGLSGEWIPVQARMFALVDVYDALRSERPYKVPVSHERAVEIIWSESGMHFAPELTAVFSRVPEDTWSNVSRIAEAHSRFRDILGACRQLLPKMVARAGG